MRQTYMPHWRRLGIALVLAVATSVLAAAREGDATQSTFTCGQDQTLPAPIPVTWAAVVLAGDGRLYSPCPSSSHGADHREMREAAVIGEARYSADRELRLRAVQAQARNATKLVAYPVLGGSNPPTPGSFESRLAQVNGLGGLIPGLTVIPVCDGDVQLFDGQSSRWQPGLLFFMLWEVRGIKILRSSSVPITQITQIPPGDLRIPVAKEGAYALGVMLSRPSLGANVVTAATKELHGCFSARPANAASFDLAGPVLEDLGLARYEREDEVKDAENFLVHEGQGTVLRTLGAVKGLEALLRQHPQHQIGDNARLHLRQLVTYGGRTTTSATFDADARIRRLAVMALQAAHDLDPMTLAAAVTDGDWQVRRLVAGSLNLSDPQTAALGNILAADSAFQVRYELLSPLSRLAAQTHQCAPIVERFKDPSPIVVMRAMDLLAATCTGLDDAMKTLTYVADQLANPDDKNWRVNVRALAALVRIKPAEAKSRLEAAAKNLIWQVRAATAAVSGAVGDEGVALFLARDPEANVRTAALEALSRMRSAAVVPQALDALQYGSDYQLIRTAARVLSGLPDGSKEQASNALLMAMRKLSDQESDTSRDSRLAILERLAETLEVRRANELLPFAADFDDEVNAAAVKTFTKLTGVAPAAGPPRRRYPYQPPLEALNRLPSQAVIQLEDGAVTLGLLKDVAPVTIARFAELATRGYYNGLTFHRVVPNFVVQGGSPGANEYMGTSRFMRDEVGPQGIHLRGAVGISTRGGDTGDGQIFIDLVDLPRLDRDYTVFAYVTQGMDLVDRILEGAKIVSISVR